MGTTRKLERYIIRHRLGSKALKTYRKCKCMPKKKSAFKRAISALKNIFKKKMK